MFMSRGYPVRPGNDVLFENMRLFCNRLYVEAEVHDVAVFDDVVFAF